MSTTTEPPLPAWLSDRPDPYLAAAMRWWWILLLGCVIGAVAAGVALFTSPVGYQSTALVQVTIPATSTDQTANAGVARSAATNFAAEGTTGQVFERAAAQLAAVGIPISADDLVEQRELGELTVRALRDTNLIAVTVADRDPVRAQRVADILAEAFIAEINTRAKTQLELREQELLDQIAFTQRELVTAQLYQREEALRRELAGQRTTLLQLQQSSVQASSGTFGPQWQQLLQEQARELERQIAETTEDLQSVRTQLAARPEGPDSTTSAALASAYAGQLNRLTLQYAQLQLDRNVTSTPVVRYGGAARALPTPASKRMPLLLAAGGVALGVFATATAEGLRLLRQYRKRGHQTTAAPTGRDHDAVVLPGLLDRQHSAAATNGREGESLTALLGRLDALGVTGDQSKRPGAPVKRPIAAED